MEKLKKIKKKAHVTKEECVACGACVKKCPLNLISIVKGIYAQIDMDKCVGCGKCAKVCPASVIEIRHASREADKNEKEME